MNRQASDSDDSEDEALPGYYPMYDEQNQVIWQLPNKEDEWICPKYGCTTLGKNGHVRIVDYDPIFGHDPPCCVQKDIRLVSCWQVPEVKSVL